MRGGRGGREALLQKIHTSNDGSFRLKEDEGGKKKVEGEGGREGVRDVKRMETLYKVCRANRLRSPAEGDGR